MVGLLLLLSLSAEFEVDCSDLPPAGGLAAGFRMDVTFELASGVRERVPFGIGQSQGADDVAEAVYLAFEGQGWQSRRVGTSVFLHGHDGSRMTKLTVESTGPQPKVRWVLPPPAPPAKKPRPAAGRPPFAWVWDDGTGVVHT